MTGISHLKKAEQRLKTCEDYNFCRKSYGQRFLGGEGGGSQDVLFIDFLTERHTVKIAHLSKLLEDRVKPSQHFLQNDEVYQSKASVSSTKTRVRTSPL